MPKYLYLWLIIFTLLITPKCNAANEVEIGGLLLDNSKSRFGHEFYYQFSQLWRDIPNTEGINIQVNEQIVPRAGTKLSLLLNGRIIYITHFGRRQSPIKEKVEQAIFILIDEMQFSQGRQDGPDLASDGW